MTMVIILFAIVVIVFFFKRKDQPVNKTDSKQENFDPAVNTFSYSASNKQQRTAALVSRESNSKADEQFQKAKTIAQTFCQFPSYVDPALKRDPALMALIEKADQPGTSSDDRRRYQAELKTLIFGHLDRCLAADPAYAPAMLLYPHVADWNCRAADRPAIIEVYERLLPAVDKVAPGTNGYDLIKQDIKGLSGNHFDKVERHLADFHKKLGDLYTKEHRLPDALARYEKSETLMPQMYAGTVGRAYAERKMYGKALEHLEKALQVRMEKSDKDLLKQYYVNIKAAMERQKGLFKTVAEALTAIEKDPGMLQKDIYSRFPAEQKSGLSGIFRDLEGEGLIVRTKKGSTYQMTLTKPSVDILARFKESLLS